MCAEANDKKPRVLTLTASVLAGIPADSGGTKG